MCYSFIRECNPRERAGEGLRWEDRRANMTVYYPLHSWCQTELLNLTRLFSKRKAKFVFCLLLVNGTIAAHPLNPHILIVQVLTQWHHAPSTLNIKEVEN